ncbi:MarR family transcriptional regulator [Mycolicibacter icosiumassiliensis]|uniref:MarR family transcriptional regulator n=1 Tax=Mycolicibacter icosiumassiliensis TaxID=1792835 RepID=UPI00082CA28F|nr:MarR family transcriptional regulator [Mycolicibacter icosiumassiliensis]
MDAFEQRRWRQLLSGSANLMAALDVRLRGAYGVTLRDVLLLELLSRPDRRAHRIGVLAQTLGVSPGALAGQVRRLEERGLVTRSPCQRDRRGILPRITSEGHARLRVVLDSQVPIADGVNGESPTVSF